MNVLGSNLQINWFSPKAIFNGGLDWGNWFVYFWNAQNFAAVRFLGVEVIMWKFWKGKNTIGF